MLDKLNAATGTMTARVERDYAAPPERVFDAWLDPTLVARWMAPGSLTATALIEAKVGGRYRVTHLDNGNGVGGFDATILELKRPKRLVFAWGLVGPAGEDGPRYDSRLTISFEPLPSGTLMTLVHDRLDAFAAALPEVAGQIEFGWRLVLAKLEQVIS